MYQLLMVILRQGSEKTVSNFGWDIATLREKPVYSSLASGNMTSYSLWGSPQQPRSGTFLATEFSAGSSFPINKLTAVSSNLEVTHIITVLDRDVFSRLR